VRRFDLLPIAACQSLNCWLIHCNREQAPSHMWTEFSTACRRSLPDTIMSPFG